MELLSIKVFLFEKMEGVGGWIVELKRRFNSGSPEIPPNFPSVLKDFFLSTPKLSAQLSPSTTQGSTDPTEQFKKSITSTKCPNQNTIDGSKKDQIKQSLIRKPYREKYIIKLFNSP